MVQWHCLDLKMSLSVTKSKVLANSMDVWQLYDGDTVVGCLEQVQEFKYLGVEVRMSPSQGALAMRRRAVATANKYRAACLRLAGDGPDKVDLAVTLWVNVAMAAVAYGAESVLYTDTCLGDIARHQSNVGKFTLGLPACAPNVSTAAILGVKHVKEVIYGAQLRYLVRLQNQSVSRWSKDAFLDHIRGGWASPYIAYINKVKKEVGMLRGPVSVKHVNIVLRNYFLRVTNAEIRRLDLPAMQPLAKRRRMDHVNESAASKVGLLCFLRFLRLVGLQVCRFNSAAGPVARSVALQDLWFYFFFQHFRAL